MDCSHEQGNDPRREGTCLKCGRIIPAVTVDSMERDVLFERAVLQSAADQVGLPHLADSLHAFADKRVMPGDILLPDGRDMVQEALEEVADCVGNYLPWEVQLQHRSEEQDEGRIAYVQEALAHGMLMYQALVKAAQG